MDLQLHEFKDAGEILWTVAERCLEDMQFARSLLAKAEPLYAESEAEFDRATATTFPRGNCDLAPAE